MACKKTFTWKEFQETFSTKIDLAKVTLNDSLMYRMFSKMRGLGKKTVRML